MKITFVIPSIVLLGGVRVVLEYANRLADLGHSVYVVFPLRAPRKLSRSKLRYILNTIKTSIFSLGKPIELDWFDLRAELLTVPSLDSAFLNITKNLIPDSDVVIATSWETAYFVAALPKKKGDKFYFVQHYEIWDIWNNLDCWKEAQRFDNADNDLAISMSFIKPKDSYLKELKELVDKTYTLPLKKITISKWLETLLNLRFNQKVYGVIPNGVNFEIFHCSGKSLLNKGKKAILMPYRGLPWKGDLDGLMALKKIYEIYGDSIEYWLFGSKNPSGLPAYFRFFERLPDDCLRDLYCSAQIFVSPSWVEGFHLPPMEAMACKCAVVATNVGGIPDFVIPNQTAIVVTARDPDALFGGILRLLENQNECFNLAENGCKSVMQFTWDNSVKKLESILLKNLNE